MPNCQPQANPRKFALAVVLAVAGAFAPASRSDAGLVLMAKGVTATAGSIGSFDVLITNTNAAGGASYGVASDVLDLALTGLTGVQFTSVSIATTSAAYIYPVSGSTLGGGFSATTFPATQFIVSDSDFQTTAPYEQLILPGESFGLAHVSYRVLAGTAAELGTISILFDAAGDQTSLSDANTNLVTFTTSPASFVVTATVPEPSALLLTASGLGIACFFRFRAGLGCKPTEEGGLR